MIVAVDLIGTPPEGWSRLAALAGHVLTGENRHVLETAIGKGIYSAAFTKGSSLDSNANPF
jgi:hypothetical protein